MPTTPHSLPFTAQYAVTPPFPVWDSSVQYHAGDVVYWLGFTLRASGDSVVGMAPAYASYDEVPNPDLLTDPDRLIIAPWYYYVPPPPVSKVLTARQINRVFTAWQAAGPITGEMISSLLQIMAKATVDFSPVSGPALLISQGYTLAAINALGFIMTDPTWDGWSIEFKSEIAKQMDAWTDFNILLEGIANQARLPTLQSLYRVAPAALYYGAIATVAANIDIKLESLLSVPTMANVTVQNFWTATVSGLAAMSRLLVLDYVISNDLTFYYGVNGSIQNVMSDLALMLREVGPRAPDPAQVLNALSAASVDGYTVANVVSVQAVRISQRADIERLAYRLLGDADLWPQLVDFNKLMWPYVSDDPVERLGRPETEHLYLGVDLNAGDTEAILTNVINPLYVDQRLAFKDADHFQVVTITSIADTEGFTMLTFSPPIAGTGLMFDADNTKVGLYPPVYDTGVVLGTGDTLLIPSTLLAPGIVLSTEFTDVERFGTDLLVNDQGELQISNGDLSTITGRDNIKQAVGNRYKVDRGSLIHLPIYGSGLKAFLPLKNSPYYANLKAGDAVQTALNDPRISSVESVRVDMAGDQSLLSFTAVTATGRLLLPIELDLVGSG